MFPEVMGRAGGVVGSNSTLHAITFPANIVDTEMLLAVVASDGSIASSVGANSASGWLRVVGTSGGDGNLGVYTKIADSNNTLNVATSSENTAWNTFRIANHRGSNSDIFWSSTTGSSSNYPNAPLTPSLGLADYLWIVCAASGWGNAVPTAAPSGFVNFLSRASGSGAANTSVATAELLDAVASKSPGNWTSPSEDYTTVTLAIPGLAGSLVDNGAILAFI